MEKILEHQKSIAYALQIAPVIPVLVIHDANIAIDLAKALVNGGLPIIEVTLRTEQALQAIERVATVDGAIVAAGTCKTAAELQSAKSAGATFAVSPGTTQALIEGSLEYDMPLLPGSDNVSLSMELLDAGFAHQKFFPAEASGGPAKLRAIGQPLPQIAFCPTGGISPANAMEYLALPNVLCIGGSWLASAELINEKDWAAIEALAKSAANLSEG